MNNKQIIVILSYLLIFGAFGFSWGHSVGTEQQLDKINELEIEKENLEQGKIEYQWLYESCLTQIGDMEDDYDVNNDGVVNAQDYVAIKNYIMEGK